MVCVCEVVSVAESCEQDGGSVGGRQSRRWPPWSQSDVPRTHRQPASLILRGMCATRLFQSLLYDAARCSTTWFTMSDQYSLDLGAVYASVRKPLYTLELCAKQSSTSTSVLTASANTANRFFCVRIESRIESAVYTSEYLIHSIGIYFVFVTNESDARNWVLVIHFNSVLKRVKLCRCTII